MLGEQVVEEKIWRPFTQMKNLSGPLPEVVGGRGSYLHLENGSRLLDGISSWWVNIHGHAHPELAQAIADQARKLQHVIFADFTHAPARELTEQLKQLMPAGLEHVFYSDDGSTAVEVALKMAMAYWERQGQAKKGKRQKCLAFAGAYHGDTFGCMSVAPRNEFNSAFHPSLFPCEFLMPPLLGREQESLAQAKELIARWGDQLGIFICEPLVQGTAGMRVQNVQALKEIIQLLQQNGTLVIADEVMTGMGRTGTFLACQQVEVVPDLVCVSKGITGGTLPLGVTVASQEIYQSFYSDRWADAFFHGHSYMANPIICAVANRSLKLLRSEECRSKIAAITDSHREFVHQLRDELGPKGRFKEVLVDVRSCGTVLALEFNPQLGGAAASGYFSGYFSGLREKIYQHFYQRGIYLRPLGNVCYFLPPYCISAQDCQRVYGAMEELAQDLLGS